MSKLFAKLFYLSIFFIPFEYLFERTIGLESEYKIYRVLIAFSFVALLASKVKVSDIVHLVFLSTSRFLIYSYLLAIASSFILVTLNAADLSYFLRSATLLCVGLSYFLIYIATFLDSPAEKSILKPFIYLLIGAISSSFLSFFLFASESARFAGLMRNPNHLGFIFGISCLYFVSQLRDQLSVNTAKSLLLFILFFVLMLTTGSRASLLSFLSAYFINFIFQSLAGKRPSLKSLIFFISLSFLPVAAYFQLESSGVLISDRLGPEQIFDAYGSGREGSYLTALEASFSNPIFGVGIGNFFARSKEFQTSAIVDSIKSSLLDVDLGAHNEYLRIAAESGIIPLLLFFLFIFTSLSFAFKTYKYTSVILPGLHAFYLPCMIYVFLFSFFQDQIGFPLYWISLGFLACCQIYASNCIKVGQ